MDLTTVNSLSISFVCGYINSGVFFPPYVVRVTQFLSVEIKLWNIRILFFVELLLFLLEAHFVWNFHSFTKIMHLEALYALIFLFPR